MILIAEYQVNSILVSRKLGKKLKNAYDGELFYDSKNLKILYVKSTRYNGVEVHLIDNIEKAIKELKSVFYNAKLPFKFQEDCLLTIKSENPKMIKTIQDNGFVFNHSEKRWEWQGI